MTRYKYTNSTKYANYRPLGISLGYGNGVFEMRKKEPPDDGRLSCSVKVDASESRGFRNRGAFCFWVHLLPIYKYTPMQYIGDLAGYIKALIRADMERSGIQA